MSLVLTGETFSAWKRSFPKNRPIILRLHYRTIILPLKGLTPVDTAKLNDFLDDVSLLTVDEYVDTVHCSEIASQSHRRL